MPEDNKIYSTTVEDGVFTMTFTAPAQLLLRSDWENMVWDQTLRMAHEAGLVPVGPIFIEHEATEKPKAEPTPLVEGESLSDRVKRWNTTHQQGILGPLLQPDLIKVTASVQVGLQL